MRGKIFFYFLENSCFIKGDLSTSESAYGALLARLSYLMILRRNYVERKKDFETKLNF